MKVIIPSGNAANLAACVHSLCEHEHRLEPADILVVDDGAREAAAHLPVTWIDGERPFIFARNVNRGIAAAGDSDVMLLNDDAMLETPNGFTKLATQMQRHTEIGICSVGIRGIVSNPNQVAGQQPTLRYELRPMAFVCVYVRHSVIAAIGDLDEQFSGYGFEDFDLCQRTIQHGWQLAIWEGCVVDHSGRLPSTFRTRADLIDLYEDNRIRYQNKWSRPEPLNE